MPGVEIHATELANRLEQRSLLFQPNSWAWSCLLGLVVITTAISVERWEKPITRLAALAAISAGFLLIGFALIAQLGLGVRLLTLSGAILMTGIVSSSEATLKLQWQRRRLRNSLGRYLSPAVAAQIASQPEEADELLGGQQADVVILMSDIRGFTSFTQQMSEANRVPDLVKRLNYYFTEVVDALHQEGATVDKFIGDACLAVFGAPIHRGNQQEAESAIRAALDIEKRLRTLNSQWKKDGDSIRSSTSHSTSHVPAAFSSRDRPVFVPCSSRDRHVIITCSSRGAVTWQRTPSCSRRSASSTCGSTTTSARSTTSATRSRRTRATPRRSSRRARSSRTTRTWPSRSSSTASPPCTRPTRRSCGTTSACASSARAF